MLGSFRVFGEDSGWQGSNKGKEVVVDKLYSPKAVTSESERIEPFSSKSKEEKEEEEDVRSENALTYIASLPEGYGAMQNAESLHVVGAGEAELARMSWYTCSCLGLLPELLLWDPSFVPLFLSDSRRRTLRHLNAHRTSDSFSASFIERFCCLCNASSPNRSTRCMSVHHKPRINV